MATSPIRIVLIDDHALLRVGLRMLIESRPGMQVAGEASNQAEALAMVGQTQPDIILLDVDLAGESGLDLLPRLCAAAAQARVILVTGTASPAEHRQAVRLGAMGVVFKEQAAGVLIKAIETVHNGQVWLDPSIIASVLAEASRQRTLGEAPPDPEATKIARLSPREREVITLVGEGLRNRQIAGRLGISEATVSHHLTSIFGKLGVNDRLDLVIYAYRHDLAKPPR